MLGFLFHKKRDEVKRLLHGRLNRSYLRNVTGYERNANRGTFSEVVWAIACKETSSADYTQVFPALTKDLSTQGVSLLVHGPVREPRMIVGLKDETDPRFLWCTVEHYTPLGYGYYQVGLYADEIIRIEPANIDVMRETLAKFEWPVEANLEEPALV